MRLSFKLVSVASDGTLFARAHRPGLESARLYYYAPLHSNAIILTTSFYDGND